MKTYRKPDIPKPEPGKKKSYGRVYAGGPGWRELNPRLKPKPDKPKPKKSKKGYYSDEEFKPINKKPGKTRRKFLEKMDKMNREAGY